MALTDANGRVRFEVPLGNYIVGPVLAPGYKVSPAQEVLGLTDGEIRQVKFQLILPSGIIEVSLVDRDGNPLSIAGVDVPLSAPS